MVLQVRLHLLTMLRVANFVYSDSFDCGDWLLYVVCILNVTLDVLLNHFTDAISTSWIGKSHHARTSQPHLSLCITILITSSFSFSRGMEPLLLLHPRKEWYVPIFGDRAQMIASQRPSYSVAIYIIHDTSRIYIV